MAPHGEQLDISQADDKLLPAQDYSLEGLNIKGSLSLDRNVDAIRNFRQDSDGAIDRPRMNLLLSGAPGTGKTEFVRRLFEFIFDTCIKASRKNDKQKKRYPAQ